MQVLDEAATKEKQEKAEEEAKKEGKEKANPVEPVMKSEGKDVWDWRVQNDNKPLWTRTPKDVSPLLVTLHILPYGVIPCLMPDIAELSCIYGQRRSSELVSAAAYKGRPC